MTAKPTRAATIQAVIRELSSMRVRPICPEPGRIRLVCDAGDVPTGAVELAKPHKAALMDALLSIDLDELEEIELADVPICDRCARFCDVQTLDDQWHCSHCDPLADARRLRTMAQIAHCERIVSRHVKQREHDALKHRAKPNKPVATSAKQMVATERMNP